MQARVPVDLVDVARGDSGRRQAVRISLPSDEGQLSEQWEALPVNQGSRIMKRILVLLVISLLFSSAAVAQKINVDWDRQANFSQYHTYMWQKSPHPGRGFWDERIVNAVDQQLQAKGLTKVDSNPDLWVVYSNSIHDQKEVVGTGYNYGPYWGWGAWGMGPTTTTYNTFVTRLGTLVVEISDVKEKDLLWRGSATDTISDNSNKNIKNLDKAVAKLFKDYPPTSKTK